MNRQVLMDTGPLVALLCVQDQHHAWAVKQFSTILPPLLTCEAVITEACFLMRRFHPGQEAVLRLLDQEVVSIGFNLNEHFKTIQTLITRYQSVPMSLADACLVVMSEQQSGSSILTLDSDFTIYRQNTNQVIPVIMP